MILILPDVLLAINTYDHSWDVHERKRLESPWLVTKLGYSLSHDILHDISELSVTT